MISENLQTNQEIEDICNKYNIKNWSINSDGLIDVDGDVYLDDKGLDKITLKFNRVSGDFNCRFNKLINLEGGPKYVGGSFNCYANKLTNLEGCPKEVGGNFYCNSNKLVSLEGSPKYVGGNFYCLYNKLYSLEGGPIKVGGSFNCSNNKLISLEGSPKHVVGYFNCLNNKLVSLEGAPDFIGGHFNCYDNPICNIWKLFFNYSNIELFNYYDIIRDLNGEPAIVLARLNQFLEDIGKQPVEKVEGYINI